MSRTQSAQIPLEFVGTTVMQWEDLPAPLRTRVREQLAALLRHAARRPRPASEGSDDE